MNDHIRQPPQDRSQATMIHIRDAFEKLLHTGGYETITIKAVAKEEETTGVGSIYARFDDTTDLARGAYTRFARL
jgi:hypothetical protein